MTLATDLHQLKKIAKRYARAQRIAHHEALDLVARELNQPHWRALTTAWKKGWRPSPTQCDRLQQFAQAYVSLRRHEDKSAFHFTMTPNEMHGTIDGHEYTLSVAFEVLMGGSGWSILLEHAPSEAPEIECYDGVADNPIHDCAFREKALKIAHAAADQLRSRIAADWPRRSTKADAEGRALHPLRNELSDKWYCLHCDAQSTGKQMAANMWHCPKCSATPIDIFPGLLCTTTL